MINNKAGHIQISYISRKLSILNQMLVLPRSPWRRVSGDPQQETPRTSLCWWMTGGCGSLLVRDPAARANTCSLFKDAVWMSWKSPCTFKVNFTLASVSKAYKLFTTFTFESPLPLWSLFPEERWLTSHPALWGAGAIHLMRSHLILLKLKMETFLSKVVQSDYWCIVTNTKGEKSKMGTLVILWAEVNIYIFWDLKTPVHQKHMRFCDASINLFIDQMLAPKSHYTSRPYRDEGLLFQTLSHISVSHTKLLSKNLLSDKKRWKQGGYHYMWVRMFLGVLLLFIIKLRWTSNPIAHPVKCPVPSLFWKSLGS